MKVICRLLKYESGSAMQHETEFCRTLWDPLNIFSSADYKYAMIILNRPLSWKMNVLLPIWEKAQVRITVDGGTHRWLNYLENQRIDVFNKKNNTYLPDLITGDMDSCPPAILNSFENCGCKIVRTPDQNKTDYTKALIELAKHCRENNINLNGIYVFVDTSGRFDHIIGNINTLYKSEKIVGDTQIIQIAHDSLTWVLRPGCHRIVIPDILVHQNSWCGLLPFGSSVKRISTTGLKWNLDNSCLQFGGLVSSSNTYEYNEVTVTTDTAVVWSMGIEGIQDIKNDQGRS